MPEPLGQSVYLTSFDRRRSDLEGRAGTGDPVFISLHMSEEFSPDYTRRAEEACRWLAGKGFRVIGDVSKKTVQQFSQPDLVRLAESFGLWALRVDYGLEEEEIAALARRVPVVLNASTVSLEAARRLSQGAVRLMAMHNFYPRPETGLDDGYFRATTRALEEAGLEVLAFVPGDEELRGPLHRGLPTLERHRGLPPSAAFADLTVNFGLKTVFAGDPGVSARELQRIDRFCREGVMELPTRLEREYESLYGRVFTRRPDSPEWLIRFTESREYSCQGEKVAPGELLPRTAGAVTLDNQDYGRYAGELQLILQDLPVDPKVNVIGRVQEDYLLLARCIRRGDAFTLTPD